MDDKLPPGLYIVATPIGNLGDLSPRAARVLCNADVIAVEDTRVTARLLRHAGSSRPMTPYHDHNAERVRPGLVARMASEAESYFREQAQALLDGGVDLLAELARVAEDGKLSSDHVRDTEPELLPWTKPVRVYKAVQDLLSGKGWTGGFRSRTIFCCDVRKRK